MSDGLLMKEIMEEVQNLQNSIQEYCPEVLSHSQYPSIAEMGDDMNKLIEHRIQLLAKHSDSLQKQEKE